MVMVIASMVGSSASGAYGSGGSVAGIGDSPRCKGYGGDAITCGMPHDEGLGSVYSARWAVRPVLRSAARHSSASVARRKLTKIGATYSWRDLLIHHT